MGIIFFVKMIWNFTLFASLYRYEAWKSRNCILFPIHSFHNSEKSNFTFHTIPQAKRLIPKLYTNKKSVCDIQTDFLLPYCWAHWSRIKTSDATAASAIMPAKDNATILTTSELFFIAILLYLWWILFLILIKFRKLSSNVFFIRMHLHR